MTFTDYPFSPPNVKFSTEMFHPNIDINGNLKIKILDSAWTPIQDI